MTDTATINKQLKIKTGSVVRYVSVQNLSQVFQFMLITRSGYSSNSTTTTTAAFAAVAFAPIWRYTNYTHAYITDYMVHRRLLKEHKMYISEGTELRIKLERQTSEGVDEYDIKNTVHSFHVF